MRSFGWRSGIGSITNILPALALACDEVGHPGPASAHRPVLDEYTPYYTERVTRKVLYNKHKITDFIS
jgi:hypothetical protein